MACWQKAERTRMVQPTASDMYSHRAENHYCTPTTMSECKQAWSAATLAAWEEQWAENKNSPWTHQLFPTVSSRLSLELRPNFFTTQAMTGHGAFAGYLYKRKRRTSDRCLRKCGGDIQPRVSTLYGAQGQQIPCLDRDINHPC